MDEYPDPDEEFELMYGDDLDVLREQDKATETTSARRSLDFSTPAVRKSIGVKECSIINNQSDVTIIDESFPDGNKEKSSKNISEQKRIDSMNLSGIVDISEPCSSGTHKRNVEDLFGDIADIEFDDDSDGHFNKRIKYDTEIEANLALINKILEERKRKSEMNNPIKMLSNEFSSTNNSSSDNCTFSVVKPSWPSIPMINCDGKTVHLRIYDKDVKGKQINNILMSRKRSKNAHQKTYNVDWDKITSYLQEKPSDKNTTNNTAQNENRAENSNSIENNINENAGKMWVERYKPLRYIELLSDESTNRLLLQWLKMWDKIVFNKEIKIKNAEINSKFNKRSGKFEFGMKKDRFPQNAKDIITELDEHNRPKYKIALLCGPPGCGKTTLAHLIAKHAGYKPVEMNASDDRNVDAFKIALENCTQMKSVLDEEKRPNCLIMDEIDGAPLPTIEYLVKFVSGAVTEKTKKGQKGKRSFLKRPIICICNDVYASSLRPLRQVAFIVHFPPMENTRLTQRLAEISLKEDLKFDLSALIALGEKTNNDIRSCLGVLHIFKISGKQVKLVDVNNACIGQKDMTKGLFQTWQEIFQIQLPKHKKLEDSKFVTPIRNSSDSLSTHSYDASFKSRRMKILDTVQSAGEYDRLVQGVYENFLDMKVRDSKLLGICEGLDWFIFYDIMNTYINCNQNYVLYPYLPYCFVGWHFLFAGLSWPKIKFPTQSFEMFQKQQLLNGIISGVDKGICPQAKPFNAKNALVMDTIPLVSHIITPSLRPVNTQLYTVKEKSELNTVVGVMLDYGLHYIQERLQDGTYSYVLDPNISKIGIFDEKSSNVRNLTYAMKQQISRELDLERIKRNELKFTGPAKETNKNKANAKMPSIVASKPVIPNHLQTLKPKKTKDNSVVTTKDFFGRTIICTPRTVAKKNQNTDDIVKSPIWYHYKEGFNNAVRRDVKISDLL